ncbi:hypothetical protein FHG87_021559 [Trinorchestia longiramus]|nr:hypothetical protein FHG87_021559 [Trinorchestia longiramus]
MPKQCGIVNYRGNYNNENRPRRFRLPEEQSERQKWLDVLPPRENFVVNPDKFFISSPDKASSDKTSSGKAPSDMAPSDKAPFDKAPFDKAPFDKAPFDKAPFDKANLCEHESLITFNHVRKGKCYIRRRERERGREREREREEKRKRERKRGRDGETLSPIFDADDNAAACSVSVHIYVYNKDYYKQDVHGYYRHRSRSQHPLCYNYRPPQIGSFTATNVNTSFSLVDSNTKYDKLFQQYPSLFKPLNTSLPLKHSVTHHIETTGPPVFTKPRRLAPQRLKSAKQ